MGYQNNKFLITLLPN